MQSCCDVAFDYVHQRKAFGQQIGEFQVLNYICITYLSITKSPSEMLFFLHVVNAG